LFRLPVPVPIQSRLSVLTANSVQYFLPCFVQVTSSDRANFCVLTLCNTGTSFHVLFSVYPVLTKSRQLAIPVPVLQCNTGFSCTCSAHRSRYRSIPVLVFLFFFQFIQCGYIELKAMSSLTFLITKKAIFEKQSQNEEKCIF
jgi:hypothetical protein